MTHSSLMEEMGRPASEEIKGRVLVGRKYTVQGDARVDSTRVQRSQLTLQHVDSSSSSPASSNDRVEEVDNVAVLFKVDRKFRIVLCGSKGRPVPV